MYFNNLKAAFRRIPYYFIDTGYADIRPSGPQFVLSVLPFSLFLPLGFMYAGVLAYLCALAIEGRYKQKWEISISHPMFRPILFLSLVSFIIAVIYPREGQDYWSNLAHYQTYLFLLLFLCTGSGSWQVTATNSLKLGAVVASTLLYLAYLGWLPDIEFFKSYVHYKGNKSILIALLLAIAAGYMIYELYFQRKRGWTQFATTIYVVIALIFFSKSRTATVIFISLCILILLARTRFSWRGFVAVSAILILFSSVLAYLSTFPAPKTCLVQDMQSYSPANIVRDRTLCTVNQVRALSQGKSTGDDGMRAEIYKITLNIIAERPFSGHGVSSWVKEYSSRSQGLNSNTMTTPHNDFLLYASELGILGLGALLWLIGMQAFLAIRIGGQRGMQLALLTVAMTIGGLFNAILRDGVFGMAFMILLANPMAGMHRKRSTHELTDL
ncbi:O-antigen ligase family protein [Undibacterium terreum]|nr:O-antigen ligase family protein [Undibacterium terreum]